ncbi:RND family efflux transporter, MFP subunit [Duganella sp. CF458]|uniref:efflux RND transporter periplasmic adaptor subunit n=1 Tax=Duganella sp. CF458 TaxID=1884368 RepID=UPI0008E6CBCC|nr:efflux RND transporter periplasmic adaptor subunit [Duganella sp. CF458]SFH00109.1 RND family efflux transporter, MFP subunit [Duganella sp. CF458]
MKFKHMKKLGLAAVAVAGVAGLVAASGGDNAPPAAAAAPATVLTVTAGKAEPAEWAQELGANGSVAAWQEAVVGSELGGLRLAEVRVNVGDAVRKGQVLARFQSETVAAEVAQQEAALEEARAALAEAGANADGARLLASSGALSGQQSNQYLMLERSARARVASAQARLRIDQLRLRQTEVVADDDGTISARSATVGAVPGQGQELFRLIRANRLEWRAEVPADALSRIEPGQPVRVQATNGASVTGRVRARAPSIDPATRNALVYVDLPADARLHAGLFASGAFQLGTSPALTVPQSAVVTRDGSSYVFAIDGSGKVARTKVDTGRRVGERVEVKGALPPAALLVAQGAGFLNDGDRVRVVAAARVAATAATIDAGGSAARGLN